MKPVWISQLGKIRRRARWMLIAQRSALLIAWLLGSVLILGFTDFILRLPATARLLQLFLGLGTLSYFTGCYLWPALRFRPSLTEVALRVEARLPNLRGHLASSLEFASTGVDQQSPLAARAVSVVARRVEQSDLQQVIRTKRTRVNLSISAVLILLLLILIMLLPAYLAVGAQRLLNPLGGAEWPKRTGVSSLITGEIHPKGRAFSLACAVNQGFDPGMRVYAHYRIINESDDINKESANDFKRVLLTYQREQNFERLIEPEGSALEIWFETDDDSTPRQRITLVPPPMIVAAVLQVSPPAYAETVITETTIALGTGNPPPGRGRVGGRGGSSILEGSHLSLRITLNKPIALLNKSAEHSWVEMLGIEIADAEADNPEIAGFTLRPADGSTAVNPTTRAAEWKLEWVITASVRLHPVLVDEHGIYGPDDTYFQIEMVSDQPPVVTITEPRADRTLLATATLQAAAEARDDVAVGRLRLEAEVQAGSSNNNNPNTNDSPPVTTVIATQSDSASPLEQLNTQLGLATLGVQAGDLVTLTAVTADQFKLAGRTHAEVRSTPRQLRIISAAEFVGELFRDLAGIRERAIQIERDQRELRERLQESRTAPVAESGTAQSTISTNDRRSQAQLSEQIARQQERLQAVAERLAENQLREDALREMLHRAVTKAGEAGSLSEASAQAIAETEQTQRVRLEQPSEKVGVESPAEKTQRDKAERLQLETEQAIAALINLLDRGADTWGAQREIERLLKKQQQLAEATQAEAEATRGRTESELTAEEQQRLKGLANRQQALAEAAKSLITALRNRARTAEETKPVLAETLQETAQQAEQEELSEQMQAAAEELAENQSAKAQTSQQAAMATLQAMLKKLAQTEKAQLEQLRRALANLLEAIKGLIADQEAALLEYNAAHQQQKYAGLDLALIQLSRNTYAIADFARATNQKFATVARRLQDAGGAQENAVLHLRHEPIFPERVLDQEKISLTLLQEALALTAQLQAQNEEDLAQQKRQELQQAYQELLKRQLELITDSAPFIEQLTGSERLSRRERAVARKFATRQAEIQTDTATLLTVTEELADSIVFAASHAQLDQQAQAVVDAYRRGQLNPTVLMRELEVSYLLEALAAALAESNPDSSEFVAETGGGSAGGGQSGGGPKPLIPPTAQLKLLKGLQETIYRSTRALSETAVLETNARIERAHELGTAQENLMNLAEQILRTLQQAQSTVPPAPPVED